MLLGKHMRWTSPPVHLHQTCASEWVHSTTGIALEAEGTAGIAPGRITIRRDIIGTTTCGKRRSEPLREDQPWRLRRRRQFRESRQQEGRRACDAAYRIAH